MATVGFERGSSRASMIVSVAKLMLGFQQLVELCRFMGLPSRLFPTSSNQFCIKGVLYIDRFNSDWKVRADNERR